MKIVELIVLVGLFTLGMQQPGGGSRSYGGGYSGYSGYSGYGGNGRIDLSTAIVVCIIFGVIYSVVACCKHMVDQQDIE